MGAVYDGVLEQRDSDREALLVTETKGDADREREPRVAVRDHVCDGDGSEVRECADTDTDLDFERTCGVSEGVLDGLLLRLDVGDFVSDGDAEACIVLCVGDDDTVPDDSFVGVILDVLHEWVIDATSAEIVGESDHDGDEDAVRDRRLELLLREFERLTEALR